MKILPNIFRPKFDFDIIRLGTDFDGGYLVEKSSVINSKFLFSFGISTNWDFEKDFIKINNNKFLAYDGSVSHQFWNDLIHKKIKKLSFNKALKLFIQKKKFYEFFNDKNFISKYIGKSIDNSITFTEVIHKSSLNDLFFKIDIEGYEYEILDEILFFQNRIIGLCIEFHRCNFNINKIISFIQSFSLELIHIHANNYIDPKDNQYPDIIELTFAKNPTPIGEFKGLPHKLDMPNKSKSKAITLSFG